MSRFIGCKVDMVMMTNGGKGTANLTAYDGDNLVGSVALLDVPDFVLCTLADAKLQNSRLITLEQSDLVNNPNYNPQVDPNQYICSFTKLWT